MIQLSLGITPTPTLPERIAFRNTGYRPVRGVEGFWPRHLQRTIRSRQRGLSRMWFVVGTMRRTFLV